jgi:hypothetical protein
LFCCHILSQSLFFETGIPNLSILFFSLFGIILTSTTSTPSFTVPVKSLFFNSSFFSSFNFSSLSFNSFSFKLFINSSPLDGFLISSIILFGFSSSIGAGFKNPKSFSAPKLFLIQLASF